MCNYDARLKAALIEYDRVGDQIHRLNDFLHTSFFDATARARKNKTPMFPPVQLTLTDLPTKMHQHAKLGKRIIFLKARIKK